MKTAELTGAALDYAVAKCEHPDLVWGSSIGIHHASYQIVIPHLPEPQCYWNPSTNWSQAGPIIEREKMTLVCAEGDYNQSKAGTPDCYDTYWVAEKGRLSAGTSYGPQGDDWGEGFNIDVDCMTGPSPLIAAMRCYVASKLGDNVEIPEGLTP